MKAVMKKIILSVKYAGYLLAGVFFITVFTSRLPAQHDWKFQVEKNGIQVYARQQEGSDFNELKVTFEAEATLSQYASIVMNIDEYKYWNYASSNPYIIKRINDSELIYYTETKAPWPVTNRYAVLHLKMAQDPKSKILKITQTNVPDQMPEKEGFIRIAKYRAVILVIPVTENKIKVEYFLSVDPGGSIPAWAINLVSKKMPVTTFSNLKMRLKALGAPKTPVSFISDK